MKVTLQAARLPFLPARVLDDESRHRTFRHPFRGQSAVARSLTTAVALPTGVIANAFHGYPAGAPGAALAAPLVFSAAIDSASRSRDLIKTIYPAACETVRQARERVTTAPGQPANQGEPLVGRYDRAALARVDRERGDINLMRWLGPPRTAALVGYAGASTAGAVGASLRLAAAAGGAASLSAAASIVGTVGGSIVAPAQAVMLVVSSLEGAGGVRRVLALRNDRRAVEQLRTHASDALLDDARETLRRRQQYAAVGIGAATLNAASQAVSFTGGVMTLSGVGAAVGLPTAVAGISGVVVAATINGVNRYKESKFMGDGANHLAADRAATRDLRSLLNRPGGLSRTLQELSTEHLDNQHTLVTAKLMSLVGHVLDREDRCAPAGRPSALEREAAVAALVETGRKHPFARTSLLKSERAALRQRFEADIVGRRFFEGSTDDVRRRVRAALIADRPVLELACDERVQQRVMTKTVKALMNTSDATVRGLIRLRPGEKSRALDGDAFDSMMKLSGVATRAELRVGNRQLAREAKRVAAQSRHDIVRQVVDLARTRRDEQASTAQRYVDPDIESVWL